MNMTLLMTVHLAKVVPGIRQAILWSVAALEQISPQQLLATHTDSATNNVS